MTIPSAGDFYKLVGIKQKENRLRYLQTYWTDLARKMKRVKILTPRSKGQACAIASFKIDGLEATKVVRILEEKFNVFTVIRNLHSQEAIRVTPNLYNTRDDLNRLLEGIEYIAKS